MKLRGITITGLKGHDQSLAFERPVSVLIGENGAGKTEVLQALSLLATGSTAGVGKTGDAILRLAREDSIEIRATFDAGTVTRSWTRDSKGSVKEAITGSLLPKGMTGKAAAGYLAGTLGGWAEAWRPGDLWTLSAAKLRARLVSLLAGDLAPEDHVPAGAPKWAHPHEGEDLGAWMARVMDVARREALDAAAERKRIETALAEHVAQYGETLGDGTLGTDAEAERAEAQAELARLREEYAAARDAERKRMGREARRAGLAAELVGLRRVAQQEGAAGVEPVEEIDVSIAAEEQAECDRERAEASAHAKAVWALAGSLCPHCGKTAADGDAAKAADLRLAAAEDAFVAASEAHRKAARGWALACVLASIRDLEAQLESLESSPPPAARPLADIEADARKAEARLALAGATGETEAARQTLEADAAKAREAEAAKARLRDLLAKVEATILDDVRQRIEGPATEALGRPVTVELVDDRGGETCRIAVGGVDVSAISTGERIVFEASLLVALASGAKAQWRPLVIDCLESVSRNRRGAFLGALAEACQRGVVDQVWVAGCPDEVDEPPEGCEVFRLGGAA